MWFKRYNNNNKMERMNAEIRDREKTNRGLKKCHSPIAKLTSYIQTLNWNFTD